MEQKNNLDLFNDLASSEEEKKTLERSKEIAQIISHMIMKRIELKLSQRDLAKLTGIKQPMIARIESLKTIPRIDTLLIICQALGLKIELVE